MVSNPPRRGASPPRPLRAPPRHVTFHRGKTPADELAQDEDHARDEGSVLIEPVVDMDGDFVGLDFTSKKPTNGAMMVLVRSSSDERTPGLWRKLHRLPEAADPCAHGLACRLLAARQKQRSIINNAIGFQSLQTEVDAMEKDIVAGYHCAEAGIDLRLVFEERFVGTP